jgi:hypothetical protein
VNRREWMRNAALLAAGVVAADQLEIVERLGWKRRLFPGWSPPARRGTYRLVMTLEANDPAVRLLRDGFDNERTFTVEDGTGEWRSTKVVLCRDDISPGTGTHTCTFELLSTHAVGVRTLPLHGMFA